MEAAEQLTAFLDENSIGRLRRSLETCGVTGYDARRRAGAVDALILGVTVRRRVLADDLGDLDDLERWLTDAIDRLLSG